MCTITLTRESGPREQVNFVVCSVLRLLTQIVCEIKLFYKKHKPRQFYLENGGLRWTAYKLNHY